jgi:hypothetical protein
MGVIETEVGPRWKFVVMLEDEHTKAISAEIGEAGSREECERLIEHELPYYQNRGKEVIQTEITDAQSEFPEGMGEYPTTTVHLDRTERE